MKVINISIFLILIVSCNSEEKSGQSKKSKESTPQASSLINCYQYATQSDTVTLKLIHVGKSITGTLVYSLKEKDKNMGTVQGFMRGNIFVADYTFLSEGVQSIRQIAFKLEGNSFIEGTGDSFEQNGKIIFKNLDSLTFSASIKLPEIACR
ncbi:MAG: hypothetical protein V4685_13370 [Bacteroidota bacterium]